MTIDYPQNNKQASDVMDIFVNNNSDTMCYGDIQSIHFIKNQRKYIDGRLFAVDILRVIGIIDPDDKTRIVIIDQLSFEVGAHNPSYNCWDRVVFYAEQIHEMRKVLKFITPTDND